MSVATSNVGNSTGQSTTQDTANVNLSSSSNSACKRYSLVKWLENSQFDAQNEWFGRLMSVQHSNIIDFDADELKPGMEISVFRNGEIWRAQVIIPKTASNTIDLPPSNHKKIRTKAMGTTGKLNDSMEITENCTSNSTGSDEQAKSFTNLTELTTSSSVADITNSQTQANNFDNLIIQASTNSPTASNTNGINNNKLNKELQFLQTAISEAGITDLYQTFQTNVNSNNTSLNNTAGAQQCLLLKSNNNFITITSNGIVHNDSLNLDQHDYQNVIQASDMHIETIIQMQNELLDQQKELKLIENETMEQLKLLHTNISRLAKKFDSFEIVISNINQNGFYNNQNTNLKTTKSTINKINNSIEQIKLVESELHKELNETNRISSSGLSSSMSPSSSSSSSFSSSNALSQTLSSLQIILNNNNNLTVTSNSHTPIQLDPHVLTNQSNKTIKQLTNEQQQQKHQNKTTTILLSSPVEFRQQQQATESNPTTNITVTSKDANEIDYSTVSLSHENDIEMKSENNNESKENSSTSKIQGIQTQIALNRFLRESVKHHLGNEFLLTNLVSDIPVNIMKSIKKEAFDKYLPHDRRPIKAWGLAMASLRCFKRDLVKNRNKQLAVSASASVETSFNNNINTTKQNNNTDISTISFSFNNFSPSNENTMPTTILGEQLSNEEIKTEKELPLISNNLIISTIGKRRNTASSSQLNQHVAKPISNKKRSNTLN